MRPLMRGAAMLVALALVTALVTAAAASGYSVERVCGTPRPGAASCAAMRLVPASPMSAEPQADPATQPDTSPFAGYLTPQDLHAAYALPNETASSATQTVAVIDAFDDPSAEADLGVYDEQFGLPACTSANGCFRKLNEQGNPSPLPPEDGEWAGEMSIDVQMAHAICQSCHVLLVEADSEGFADLGDAVNAAVDAGATEISNSYVGPEERAMAGYFAELAASSYDHPGVVVTASSGDCGYLNEACAGWAAAANFPADSPDVVAVGGTSLLDKNGAWSSRVWDEAGSGCSQIFAAPEWQNAVAGFAATGCGSMRSLADVAAVADPNTGVDVYDSTPEGNGEPTGWTVFGGTSVSSPIVAAEFALAGGSGGVAYPAATLYQHVGEAAGLYDVLAGSNGSCGGASACQATVGFDGPTGVGSPLGLGAFAIEPAEEIPKLESFTPSSGITGSAVQIEGSGLGAVRAVQFGALAATFRVVSSTRIEATVPNGASAAKISLSSAGASSTSKHKFKPTFSVTSFTPASGPPGTVVTIKGVGFNSSSHVSFAGVAATVEKSAAKKLKVIVPSGASAGDIAVRNTLAPVGAVVSAAGFTP
jgi:hypothetical protein